MRFSIVAVLAATVAVASAQSNSTSAIATATGSTPVASGSATSGAPAPTTSAAPVDPYYPFQPNGPCVHKCLTDAGKSMYSDFTTDPHNPNFIKSLGYAHDRGTPKYTAFHTTSGMCIAGCPKSEQDHYSAQNDAKTVWYAEHKNDQPKSAASSVAASGVVAAAALLSAVALF
ncbi:hypothetical protein KVV02_003283 [Mortierella alpina]|uniref:Secreted protein n=1 Tax=Mortierella alpina TaxID=64518 RepID=A0A9P8CZX2_MORAP|nr:hypothetical protein KVV02_003283 [Mortierella alpina]